MEVENTSLAPISGRRHMRLYTSMEAILTLIQMRSSQPRQGTKATREREKKKQKRD
jgi:hypothetical protein